MWPNVSNKYAYKKTLCQTDILPYLAFQQTRLLSSAFLPSSSPSIISTRQMMENNVTQTQTTGCGNKKDSASDEMSWTFFGYFCPHTSFVWIQQSSFKLWMENSKTITQDPLYCIDTAGSLLQNLPHIIHFQLTSTSWSVAYHKNIYKT